MSNTLYNDIGDSLNAITDVFLISILKNGENGHNAQSEMCSLFSLNPQTVGLRSQTRSLRPQTNGLEP